MKILMAVFFCSIALAFPRNSYAIIFIPALILIPIAKILAVFIAGFSLPAIGLGAVWSRLSKRPLHYGVLYGLCGLLSIAIIIGIILKIIHPDRPIF